MPSAVFILVVTLQTKFSLSSKFEISWEYAKDLYTWFIDIEKAFDLVPRENLWRVLWEYSVDSCLLLAVMPLYSCSKVCVCVR